MSFHAGETSVLTNPQYRSLAGGESRQDPPDQENWDASKPKELDEKKSNIVYNIRDAEKKSSLKEARMDHSIPKSHLGMIIMLGSVWGLSEAALGMGLRSCAAHISGSLMTGVALFFMAAGWVVSRRISGVFLMVVVAAFFKMFDALLLSLPIRHGAIGNPIFAFFMEAAALIVLVAIIKEKIIRKPAGQALLGGLAASLAANLFPLVKYATGIPACVVTGTGYPLSLYYIHFAVLASVVTVPLGFLAGAKIESLESRLVRAQTNKKLEYILSPAAFIFCLAVVALLRLA